MFLFLSGSEEIIVSYGEKVLKQAEVPWAFFFFPLQRSIKEKLGTDQRRLGEEERRRFKGYLHYKVLH